MNIYESFINIHHFVTHKQDKKTSKVRAIGELNSPAAQRCFACCRLLNKQLEFLLALSHINLRIYL